MGQQRFRHTGVQMSAARPDILTLVHGSWYSRILHVKSWSVALSALRAVHGSVRVLFAPIVVTVQRPAGIFGCHIFQIGRGVDGGDDEIRVVHDPVGGGRQSLL